MMTCKKEGWTGNQRKQKTGGKFEKKDGGNEKGAKWKRNDLL